jgi:exodeoxyribonuclease VII small subunit
MTAELGSFEKSMERLEKIAQALETGTAGLEESLRLFEEGMRITKELSEVLSSAQGKVEELLSEAGLSEEELPGAERGASVADGTPGPGTGA